MNTTSLFLLPCSGILVSCVCVISCFWLFATPWTVAHQPPLSMEFSRQEYWNGLPFPPSEDLPTPRIKPSYFWEQPQCRRCKRWGFDPWVGKILWRREWQPIPVFLPGKFHGQRRLVGYSHCPTGMSPNLLFEVHPCSFTSLSLCCIPTMMSPDFSMPSYIVLFQYEMLLTVFSI